MFSFNDVVRHAERRRVFNVDGLRRLAAQSVDRSPDDIVEFAKLAEGGFNRTFLITMHDGFQMVARIPYPATVPQFYAVAGEAATLTFLRSSGLPIPQVYEYSPVPDNAAETEYIFMEFIQGTKLSDVWFDLISRQLAQLESKMMSIPFPAGGSLDYTQDLEKVAGGPGIPLGDHRFCVGPDYKTAFVVWQEITARRRPGTMYAALCLFYCAEEVLVGAAHKELAYLKRFGQPLLPFQHMRREGYQYQEQSPSATLRTWIAIASSLVPRDPALSQFRIRHPDLQESNIFVSRSPDSNWQINYDDPIPESMTRPSLPDDLNDLNKIEQSRETERYHRRLVHYHYVKNTEKYNELHYKALTDPAAFSAAAFSTTPNWETLTGGGAPCPIVFDAADIRETMKLDEVQRHADGTLDAWRNMIGFGLDGWESALAAAASAVERSELSAEEYAEIVTHWPLADMDEEKYT
ncbi:kinase-like domain-containing protein [Mycena haematopus]|nr:kinase-like domain-containing protein [Mycena haematopus]